MKIQSIPFKSIVVPPNRQRQEFNSDAILDLQSSIAKNGLISPIIVRRGDDGSIVLVAGERRLRALSYLWNFGESLTCGTEVFPREMVPCIWLGDLDEIDAFEIELEENIRRMDLTWQERAQAVARLAEFRQAQALKASEPPPTLNAIAKELYPDTSPNRAALNTRTDLIVSRHLGDPDVAKAKTAAEGLKIIKRKEELSQSAKTSTEIGKFWSSDAHTLIKGNALNELGIFAVESFDVILSDPPYGINASDFGDSGGIGGSFGAHFYDDSPTEWRRLMEPACALMFKVSKPQAHCYLFCDVDMFTQLKVYMSMAGWKCFRTPLVWVNPSSFRTPWISQGPQRKYQLILFAMKGDRNVNFIAPDVLTFPADANLNHPAQKPVVLYTELLRRSCRADDSVLDPFCGTGPIFPAADKVLCRATGIEIDGTAHGIAAQRLKDLSR